MRFEEEEVLKSVEVSDYMLIEKSCTTFVLFQKSCYV